MQSIYPLGPQTVSMKLPQGVKVRSVELLQTERNVPFHIEGQTLRFIVPRVEDYEIAGISVE
jgi:hypothetical protein